MSGLPLARRVSSLARDLPIGSAIGLALMVVGLAGDLLAHLDPALDHDRGATTDAQLSAHLLVFIGMALVLVGVVIDGVRRGHRTDEPATEGRNLDALR